MKDSAIAKLVRGRIVRELQGPGVREILLRHIRAELLTGVASNADNIAKEISAYIQSRMPDDEP